jgi:hypothetical protein
MMCTLSTPSFGPPDVKHFASAVLDVAIASITAIHHAIIASGFAIASNVTQLSEEERLDDLARAIHNISGST